MSALGIAGAVIAAGAAARYIHTILRKETRPHRVTWGVWALVGVLGAGSALEGGAGPGAYVALVFLALQITVFLLSLSKRFGKRGGRRYDGPLGIAAVTAVVLWQSLDLPAPFAATVAVAGDGLALWPTLRESWRQPRTESLSAWVADSLAAGLGLLAVADLNYAALAYPTYLVLGNGAVAGALLIRWLQRRETAEPPRTARSSPVLRAPEVTPPPGEDGLIWSSTDFPYMCLMDETRTLAFREAIEAIVKPDDVVVDIGFGTGILALFAARAGARKVYAVETDHTLAEALRSTARANGFGERIEVLEADARTACLPPEVDVVIAELIETALIDELQLPVLDGLVRAGVIGPKTRVIPEAYTTYAEPIHSDNLYYDFKISAPKHQWPFYGHRKTGWYPVRVQSLAERKEVITVDFRRRNTARVACALDFAIADCRPVAGIRLSGLVHLRPGQTIGSTNALNGEKIVVLDPVLHQGCIRLLLSYEMGEGMKSLRMDCGPHGAAPRQRRPRTDHGAA